MIMDGDDKEDGTRNGIFGGRMPWMLTTKKMDDGDKEDGWRQQRCWKATWHFWGRNAMDGDDKEG